MFGGVLRGRQRQQAMNRCISEGRLKQSRRDVRRGCFADFGGARCQPQLPDARQDVWPLPLLEAQGEVERLLLCDESSNPEEGNVAGARGRRLGNLLVLRGLQGESVPIRPRQRRRSFRPPPEHPPPRDMQGAPGSRGCVARAGSKGKFDSGRGIVL